MASRNITLEWTELENIKSILFPEKSIRGIYFWGFKLNGLFLPYYVGIADSIYSRMYQHVNSIIGGQYTIYHCNSLDNFKEFKSLPINAVKSYGKLYSPNWPKEYSVFLQTRKGLQKHIDFMVDNFVFSYAHINQNITDKELKEIEKTCINKVGKENLQNTRSGKSDIFNIKHLGCEEVVQKFPH